MDIEELQKKLEEAEQRAKALQAKADRVEEESKKFKSRAFEAEEKISLAEKAKLEEQGKLEELLAKEREEKSKLAKTLETRTQGVLREKLRAELSRYAKDAHDVDMLLKVSEHKELLSIDEEALAVSGVEDFVGKVKETHSYLFKKANLDSGDDKKPNMNTKSDDEKYLEELEACNSRAELDKLRKKYGKN